MKKWTALLLCAVLLCGMAGCAAKPSWSETYAISCVNSMKSDCGALASFSLNGDVLAFSMESAKDICYFEYSAQNGYGAFLKSDAIFCDGQYLGSEAELREELDRAAQERKDMDSLEEKEASLEKTILLLGILQELGNAKLDLKLSGGSSENVEIIPEKLVRRGIKG